MRVLTVKELKDILDKYPDDSLVVTPDQIARFDSGETNYVGIDSIYSTVVEYGSGIVSAVEDGNAVYGGVIVNAIVLE